jgi:hypothetical protein
MPEDRRNALGVRSPARSLRRGSWLGLLLAVAWCGTAGATIVPAGSFVFDGGVNAVVRHGDDIYVGGSFTQEQKPTGGGLVLARDGSGEPDASAFPQVAGTVAAIAADGSGGWFVGGDFSYVGGEPCPNLAHIRSDGTLDTSWNPDPTGPVSALAVSGSSVYVGGYFNSIGGQSRFDLAAVDATTGQATAWNPDPDGDVSALAVSGSTVYVSGGFQSIGRQSRNGLAALDAATAQATPWNPDPDNSDSDSDSVSTLAASASTVYLSGDFESIGGQQRNGLAAVDAASGNATAWNPHPDGEVRAVVLTGSTVYVAGSFDSMGGQPRNSLAALDATTGSATTWAPDLDGDVRALAVSGSTVYVGGSSDLISGRPRSRLAALDTTTGSVTDWNPSPNGDVDAIAVSGSSVYAGGAFTGAGTALSTIRGIAKLNSDGDLDTSWAPDPDPDGPHGSVYALAVSGSSVYVGGDFSSIGGQPRASIAALDAATGNATAWNPHPSAVNSGGIYAIAVTGSMVYVGGEFLSIGGQSRNGLAALDGTTGNATAWDPKPIEPESCGGTGVGRLTVSGSLVYVGGCFDSIGGQQRSYLAALDAVTGDATAWNPNPNGEGALAIWGSTVYFGGGFSSIGGQTRRNLAALDAATGSVTPWNPDPVDGSVYALAVSGPTVYVSGDFDSVGGRAGVGLAALDAASGNATAWDPGPVHGDVYALAVSGSNVYAGGSFNSIGGRVTGPFAVLVNDSAPAGDTAPPSISITVPADGQHVARRQSVTPAYSCDDGGASGVQSCSAPGTLDTSTAGAHEFTVTATDQAGNTTSKTVDYTVDGDAGGPGDTSPPSISITTPSEGQHVALGQSVAPLFSCDDGGGSGVQSCSAPAMLDTTTAGAHEFTVAATDRAGNTTSKTVSYVVDGDVGGGGTGDETPPPTAKLTGAATQKVARTVAVTISCPDEACAATTTASVRVPKLGRTKAKTYKLKTIKAKIAKGAKASIKLVLSTAARAAIRRALLSHKRIVAAIKVTIADPAGNQRVLTRQVRFKR